MTEPKPPETPDYYADLGLGQYATLAQIKRAHHSLAKKWHPDKQGLGKCIDASEFRKIREAFEYLRDETKRSKYDAFYPRLQQEWAQYYARRTVQLHNEERRRVEDMARQERAAELERVRRKEEERRIARERAEREQKAAEEKEARIRAVEEQLAREKEEHEKARRRKEALAEQRSQEAAQKAREQQEIAANERLRKEKELQAERKSVEAGERARQKQIIDAEERLKMILREEKQIAIREKWASLRDSAELRQESPERRKIERVAKCGHALFSWPRKRGKANCAICGRCCYKYHFQCPQCGVLACRACKVSDCVHLNSKYNGI